MMNQTSLQSRWRDAPGKRWGASSTGRGRGRARAFTLIEVMIAITLFSLITLAIYATFRTGLRAMALCDSNVEVLQAGRMSLELITRDLRSAFYRYDNDYDHNFRRAQEELLTQMSAERFLISQGQDPKRFDPDDPLREDLFAKLNERGRPVDLSFRGQDSGDTDQLDFVRYYAGGYEPIGITWHLGRVSYFVKGGHLYRSEADPFRPEYNFWGEPLESEPAPKELVAKNVVLFDVSYGYWFHEEWLIAQTWDSKQKKWRNPMSLLDDLPPFDPDSDEYAFLNFLRASRQRMREDGLPAYVDIALGIQESGKSERIFYYQTRVFMPTSQETYEPFKEDELTAMSELGIWR